MPKRLLDSSYLNSPSLDRCSFAAQDAFPRFILLADDFGCFEADARKLVALGWTSRRIDVTEAKVSAWLEEYVWAGMAVLWTENERRYCFLTGWNGEHGQKKRAAYDPNAPRGTPAHHGSKRKTPEPPADLVAAVLAGARRDHDGKPPGIDREGSDEISNGIVPAREVDVSRQIPGLLPPDSRSVPAPVVPVPVPGPVPRKDGQASPSLPESDEPHRPLLVLDETLDKPPLPATGPTPYQLVVRAWFSAWERAGRGKHSPLTEAEGAQLKRLTRQLGADELLERIERAFADPWFLDHGDLLSFVKQRDKFARPGRVARIAPLAQPLPTPDPSWLDSHPGASERWAEYQRQAEFLTPVGGTEYPIHLAGFLKQLQSEFDTAGAA